MNNKNILLSALLVIFLGNCAIGPSLIKDPITELEGRFEQVVKEVKSSKNALAEIGRGRSSRRDIANTKAMDNGRLNLAKAFETKIQNLQKTFIEEVGSIGEEEINELFSSTTKSVTDRVLKGTSTEKTEYVRETVNGKIVFTCYVVMVMDASSAYGSFNDELKNKDTKTYERFRASQAFEELESATN